jgi:hypothetical protein
MEIANNKGTWIRQWHLKDKHSDDHCSKSRPAVHECLLGMPGLKAAMARLTTGLLYHSARFSCTPAFCLWLGYPESELLTHVLPAHHFS